MQAGGGEPTAQATTATGAGLLVAIPLYRGAELVGPLFAALTVMAAELAGLNATILLLIDSPDDEALLGTLARETPGLAATLAVETLANLHNLGFVRTANRAMALALERGQDVLLLNSDALPRPGAFAEMVAVAGLDPMIGAVSPRSDNATICNSPYLEALRGGELDANYAAHRRIEPLLPRFTFAPTVVGFCLYLPCRLLREFGLFDEAYQGGYNEENDLIRRINQCGYRAVLANHAYVHHLGEASFAQSETPRATRELTNRKILVERYPEFPALVERYFAGAEFCAQRLLGGLIPEADGRLRLLFDCRFAGSYFSGTHEHAFALLRAFAAAYRDRYAVWVVCDARAYRFHGLDREPDLAHCTEAEAETRPFAAVMRIGQPFKPEDLPLLAAAAPVAGVLMLDTIAMDCQQLDANDLDAIWGHMLGGIDLVGFNSRFTQDQFERRFAIPGRVGQFVSRCSTAVGDYPAAAATPGDAVLVVGNHYPHKHVRPMVEALRRADPDRPLLVLGLALTMEGVESHPAGELPNSVVNGLYDRAAVVVLPSHYEGFGLPIMHGLARRRPVVARDLPFAHEIKALCPQAVNLHLAGSTEAMTRLALQTPAWVEPASPAGGEDWTAAARAVAVAIERALAAFDFQVLRARQAAALWLDADSAEQPAARSEAPLAAREGFMLGEELRALTGLQGREARRELFTPWRDLVRDDPAGGGVQGAGLRLRTDDAGLSLHALQTRLLGWLDQLPVDGRLQLELACPDDDVDADPALVVQLTLVASGVTPLEVSTAGGTVLAHGIKRRDWREAVAPSQEDDVFVERLYQRFLGRDPDEAGARNYIAELAQGRDRLEITRAFVTSPERLNLIREQLDGHLAAARS